MSVYYDQLHWKVELSSTPKCIISLVPSQTELLFDLGLAEQIAGITKYCNRPANIINSITKVGGTKQIDFNVIKQLNPDLIIANKEENNRADIEALMQHYPVWISDIQHLNEALDMIIDVGKITDSLYKAHQLSELIKSRFNSIQPTTLHTAVYLIWRKPYMAAGTNTFINEMMRYCGFENALQNTRYPVIDAEMLRTANPQYVMLSSEPYPFRQKHVDEVQSILPNSKICLVDGEMFSWYGSRLQYAPAYFNQLKQQLFSKN